VQNHRFDDLILMLTPFKRADNPVLALDRLARAVSDVPFPRRRALKAVVALALAAPLGQLAAPEPARAAGQQTATCNPPPSSTGNATLVLSGNDRLAQTFVPELGGKLSRVELKISVNAETSGDLVVKIAAVNATGTPTNRILAATTVPGAALPVNTATVVAAKFRRRSAAKVVAGMPYAIIVERQGDQNLFFPLRTDNPCPVGAVFKSLSKSGPFEETVNGNDDLFFTVFVGYA
jgi:hypothetical protein